MVKYRRIYVSLTLAWGLALSPAFAQGEADRPPADDPAWQLCSETAAQVEAEQGLPAHLLAAVSLAETGRSGPNRQTAAWPWTVHDGTRGYHFATQQEAVEFVRGIRTDGRRSIDVGCMQVNLRHHPRAFTSVSMGFDAKANIEYAAGFLKDLASKSGSWEEAIAKYHTLNPTIDGQYAPKVLAFWARERARAADTGRAHPAGSTGRLIQVGSTGTGRLLAMPAQPTGRTDASRLVIASAAPAPELTLRSAVTPTAAAISAAVPAGETGALTLRRAFGSDR